MFSEKDLQKLLNHPTQGQVLSVYLNTNPAEVNPEAAKLQLRNLLKSIDLPKDVQAVENFVDFEYDWAARGLGIFSEQAMGFFQAIPLGLSVADRIHIAEQPVIRPLISIDETFKGWGIVLVDKQGARLFSFNNGILDEIAGVTGGEVRQTKRGGGNAMHGRMGGSDPSAKIENVIEQNIKEVIDSATTFFSHHHIRRIMIGGSEDNIGRFMEELPKSWQSLVAATFPMSMTANHQEVLEQAAAEARNTQARLSDALVEQAITLAAKGANGVTGVDDTLNAIREGRVKTMLVLDTFEQPGYRCNGCGLLTGQELQPCPFCGDDFTQIGSAIERAIQQALNLNAEVKVVKENSKLEKAGRIAAILRY